MDQHISKTMPKTEDPLAVVRGGRAYGDPSESGIRAFQDKTILKIKSDDWPSFREAVGLGNYQPYDSKDPSGRDVGEVFMTVTQRINEPGDNASVSVKLHFFFSKGGDCPEKLSGKDLINVCDKMDIPLKLLLPEPAVQIPSKIVELVQLNLKGDYDWASGDVSPVATPRLFLKSEAERLLTGLFKECQERGLV